MASKELAVHRFAPATLDERLTFAKALAGSDMLPKQYRGQPANLLLAMEFGDSLGLPMVQAISTINVIEGKPSASAALISALVRRAGHKLRVSGDDRQAVATIVRSDDPDFEYTSTWTVERAEHAGLCKLVDGRPKARSQSGKVLPWEAYTAALLKARAITEVARDACQEALMGVQYTPEELGADVDAEGSIVSVVREDQPDAEPAPVNRRSAGTRKSKAAPAEPAEDAAPAADGGDASSDEIVDAEIVDTPPPVVLPDDFDVLVQNAEENRDRDSLLDLLAMAKESGNGQAVAAVTAAGLRLKRAAAAEPETGAA